MAAPEVIETAWIRRWRNDLSVIDQVIAQSGLDDELTLEISNWRGQFHSFLQSGLDAATIEREFLTVLQQLLVDPITHAPLNLGNEPLLGINDRRTYGRMSLCVHWSHIPEELLRRSPLNAQDETPFTVLPDPHPVAAHVIRWLDENHPTYVLHSTEIENAYEHLRREGRLPEIPTPHTERMRRLRSRQAQRMRLADESLEAFEHQLLGIHASIVQMTQEQFRPVHDRIEGYAQHTFTWLDRLSQEDRDRLRQLAIDQLENGLRALENNLHELREAGHATQRLIVDAERDNEQLRSENGRLSLAIDQLRHAIQKRKHAWVKDLFAVAAIVGACALSTWALQGMIGATGATSTQAAALPRQTGAILRVSLTF